MNYYILGRKIEFPDPTEADEYGLVAIGGDLSVQRLLAAYKKGIFPWYSEDPILWFSPDPRMVLLPTDVHIGRTLRSTVRKQKFEIRMDTAFEDVITFCAATKRPNQGGTWITDDMLDGYIRLHRQGYAHSVESWLDGKLVGGLYGVSLGAAFFGESMFAHHPDASKVAFVYLIYQAHKWGFHFIDCQDHTNHLERFGAVMWPRDKFLEDLKKALVEPTKKGKWQLDLEEPIM